MKRVIMTSLVLALWGGVGLNFASAQFGGLGQAPIKPRPTVSPFVNMGLGGAGAYYGIVKPQIDATKSINELQVGLNQLTPDGMHKADGSNALGGAQTGHAATFFNYGHYYPGYPASPGGTTLGTPPGSGSPLGSAPTSMLIGNNLAVPFFRP